MVKVLGGYNVKKEIQVFQQVKLGKKLPYYGLVDPCQYPIPEKARDSA